MATTVALLVLYGLYDDSGQPQFSNGVAALYNATHRTAWAAVVCWVIIACATGHGGKWPLICFSSLKDLVCLTSFPRNDYTECSGSTTINITTHFPVITILEFIYCKPHPATPNHYF